jgi:hypothetical protein
MRTRLLSVALALFGFLALAEQSQAQVITYTTYGYYNTPFNPLVRTYNSAVFYSNYTSPIMVPTYFVSPEFGSVRYAAHYGAAAPGTPTVYPIGYSTYSTFPVPVGRVYYSGDASIPPTVYQYNPYATYGGYISPFPLR